jgi:hypothetical protein
MPAWPSSLRSRLTLWYTVLLGLPLIVFAIICYAVFARTLQSRTDRFIGDALTAFSRELIAERRAALSAAVAMRRTLDEVRFPRPPHRDSRHDWSRRCHDGRSPAADRRGREHRRRTAGA